MARLHFEHGADNLGLAVNARRLGAQTGRHARQHDRQVWQVVGGINESGFDSHRLAANEFDALGDGGKGHWFSPHNTTIAPITASVIIAATVQALSIQFQRAEGPVAKVSSSYRIGSLPFFHQDDALLLLTILKVAPYYEKCQHQIAGCDNEFLLSSEVMRVTDRQIRAARALLGIDGQALADMSGVSLVTVRRVEGNPDAAGYARQALIAALEKAGIEFIEDRGVVLRK